MSGASDFAERNRIRWLSETYATLIEEKGIYTDFRVMIKSLETEETLMIVGGIWHNLAAVYISEAEAEALQIPVKTTWWLNGPQVKLFSLLPHMLDKDREIPISQIMTRGGRRSGKTEGAIRLALSTAAILPFSKIGIFGMDHKSNGEMLLKILAIMPNEWYAHFDASANTLYLKNGSTIIFFSQRGWKKAGRSYSFDLLLLDELPTYDNPGAVLEGCRGGVIEYDGAIVCIYTPPPVHDVCYWEEQKSRSPDPELNQAVKTIYFGSTFDNVTLSQKAKRKTVLMAKNMGKAEYEREILGKWSRSTGVAFYDFKKELHVVTSVPSYLVDITEKYCSLRWYEGAGREWICGMDFNENPMTFAIYKLYWDPSGGTLVQHADLHAFSSGTEKFIYSDILPWLRSQYPAIEEESELVKKIIIVADNSAWWQSEGPKRKSKDIVTIPSYRHLVKAGFFVVKPKPYRGGSNSKKVNTDRVGKNPARQDRMESYRSRLLDRFGLPHVLFMDRCAKSVESIENIPLENGIPDFKSDYSHLYDACSYPIYNMYPKIQLSTTDPDTLNVTYTHVHQCGLEVLTAEQRQAHPMVIASGREILT